VRSLSLVTLFQLPLSLSSLLVCSATVTKLAIGVEGGFQVEEDRWEGVQDLAVALLRCGVAGSEDVVRLYEWNEWKDHLPLVVREAVIALLARVDTSKLAPLAWQDDPPKESKYAKVWVHTHTLSLSLSGTLLLSYSILVF
jgi:hypothetical protein